MLRCLVKRRDCMLDWKRKTNFSESLSRVEWGEVLFPSLKIKDRRLNTLFLLED